MADNVAITAGTGTSIATDDVAGVHFQKIKVDIGGNGVEGGPWDGVVSLSATDNAVLDNIDADTSAIQTAVQIMDDWDETDRAKVNIIAGQAGITAGAGAVSTNTPRVTLASDDPGVALLGTIDADTGNIATSVGVMDDWDNGASDGASVSGDVAHDTADAGEPLKIGAKAIDFGASPTAVAANDRTNLYANRAGVLFTLGGHPNIVTLEAAYTSAQTNQAIVTVAAGTIIVVTSLNTRADNANTNDTGFRVGFATATTPTTTGVVDSHPGVAAGSGTTIGDGNGIVGIGATDEDLRITSEDPGGAFRVVVKYFTIAIG